MQALNSAAEAAGALVCDINTQISFVTDKIRDLQSAVLLGSAPQGVALTSGEHLQLSSTRNTMVNAGQHLDIGAMKNLSVTVEKALGMFVIKKGVSWSPTREISKFRLSTTRWCLWQSSRWR
jgi:type VI secretion system secreted protein VgrG